MIENYAEVLIDVAFSAFITMLLMTFFLSASVICVLIIKDRLALKEPKT